MAKGGSEPGPNRVGTNGRANTNLAWFAGSRGEGANRTPPVGGTGHGCFRRSDPIHPLETPQGHGVYMCKVQNEIPVAQKSWIPAFAGMTEEGLRASAVRTIIPAFAGMTEESPRAGAVRTVIPVKPALAKARSGYPRAAFQTPRTPKVKVEP